MSERLFKKVVIVGVGLIGASIAAAIKKRNLVEYCVGVDQSIAHQQTALAAGWIVATGKIDKTTLNDCDLFILCTPVATLPALYQEAITYLPASAIITDVGSTKATLAEQVALIAQPGQAIFIPAHPIAGSQNSGPAAADADLFNEKTVVLTPLANTPEWALQKLKQFWKALGASIVEGSPTWHDEVFAEVSHVPHLLAALAINEIAKHPDAETLWALAGTGLRDFTRIGAGHPEMWRDISLENRTAIVASLRRYQNALEKLTQSVEAHDGEALYHLFDQARLARAKRWV